MVRFVSCARTSLPLASSLATATLVACGGGAGSGDAGSLRTEVDTVADTVVVRTVAGSIWDEPARLVPEVTIGVLEGEQEYMFGNLQVVEVGPDGTIYALDRQIPAVRVYGSDGVHRATWARSGGGPGELARPDAGMVMLSDGRLVVRDPGNARLQVFNPDGSHAATWPVIRGGFNTSNPLLRGPGDTLLTPVLVDAEVDVSQWRTGLQRMDPTTGEILDTLEVPDVGYEAPRIEARHESDEGSSVSINGVPFSPSETWAYHPGGFFLHGVSTEYRFTVLDPAGPRRIERAAPPVPVAGGERSEAEAQATRNMRGTDPNWRWNGPPIPDSKPPYRGLFVGRDGRIWVHVATEGVEGEDPDYDPTDPEDVPDRWSEPVAFDLFQPDGGYVGRVETPEGFSLFPRPIFDAEHVWAVVRDDFDVQRVVRFRITPVGELGEG